MWTPEEKDGNGFVSIAGGLTSDSGAADTVAPEEYFPDYPLEESASSKKNVWYVGPGGQRIKNKGQKTVLMLTKDRKLRWMTFQIAKVKKILVGVSKNLDAGQRVVYDDESFIEDKRTKDRVELERARGVFKFEAHAVPFSMVKAGIVKYVDSSGKLRKVKVDKDSSFGRRG